MTDESLSDDKLLELHQAIARRLDRSLWKPEHPSGPLQPRGLMAREDIIRDLVQSVLELNSLLGCVYSQVKMLESEVEHLADRDRV